MLTRAGRPPSVRLGGAHEWHTHEDRRPLPLLLVETHQSPGGDRARLPDAARVVVGVAE